MSGLTGSPLRYCLHVPAQGLGSLSRQVSDSRNIVKFGENMALHCLKRYSFMTFNYLPFLWWMDVS